MLAAAGLCGCNSMSGSVNNQIGMWNYQQGNYQAAREEFSRAAADDPQNASFTYNLASALKRQGDFHATEATYLPSHSRSILPHQPCSMRMVWPAHDDPRGTSRLKPHELVSTWAAVAASAFRRLRSKWRGFSMKTAI